MALFRGLFAFVLIAGAAWASNALATESRPGPSWVVVGAGSVQPIGDRVYLGGAFLAGPRSGPFAVLTADTATADTRMPEVTGVDTEVFAVEPDGAGGWFIGGRFSHVGGLPRSGIAHVLADGRVDPGFAPVLDRPGISEIAVAAGTVYIYGGFESVSGVPRRRLAALDSATGAVLPWDPGLEGDVYSSIVTDLEAGSGVVYLAGTFKAVGAAPRAGLAAVDAETGQATAFRADLTSRDYGPFAEARSIDLAGDTLYAVGSFTHIGGVERLGAGAVDAQTGGVRGWNPAFAWSSVTGEPLTPTIKAVAAAPDRVFVGGWFNSVNGHSRPGLAATDPAGGATLGWQPAARAEVGGVEGLTYGQGRIYSAGLNVGFDADSGALVWAAELDGGIDSLALDGGRVAIGGNFNSVAVRPAPGLLALDTGTGEPATGVPQVREGADAGGISGMVAVGETLYLAGEFDSIGGEPRAGFAAIDGATGEVLPWAPEGGTARLAAASRRGVYITRHDNEGGLVAALDPDTGEPLPFRARFPEATVTAVEPAGGLVYVAHTMLPTGDVFDDGPGYVTARTASLGRPCWRVKVEGKSGEYRREMGSYDLAMDGRRLYVAGHYTSIGGRGRVGLAALDPRTGRVQSWNPAYGGIATSLAVAGGSLFVAGIENPLIELKTREAARADFDPQFWGATQFMYASPPALQDLEVGEDGTVHVVGSFQGTRDAAARGYAAFSGAPEPEPPAAGVTCPDRTAPRLGISNRTRRLDRALRSGLLVGVRLNERARVELRAYTRRVRIARRSLTLAPGWHRVRMRLASRARRHLAGRERVTVILKASARDRAGNERGPVRRRVRLVGAPRE